MPEGNFLARGTNPHILIAGSDLSPARVARILAQVLRDLDKIKGAPNYPQRAHHLLFKSGLLATPIFPHEVNHRSPYRIATRRERSSRLRFPY
ncbi:hypothetical protein A2631_03650 [Candidatus Daviesbacteria bacterium RIFCSPHIGHO2_01_FULL_44_29]|uniref:Uncharacterized protein n=1 Tax=Candidatus Daviesbacteria bacterium RIFCSPHIGHO2_02_FULL_43_12 TaxID=1797776 RepID=A0A1F5KHZ0_9BACT|nr:MAG: hypothetical protein A2631_03650 [Candidatus Daviesbacteria bacterium RIFCSPHIGHO2_01_FULL_44_29]OGE39830.1 MAG: hypothetical protein A3E86_04655 [Candidatus Daviesbacteria bacterium RIFCSPHIGHO2_12_FULL_47_45]OGE40454.1 MAG: hypothetical protein A3D25_00110 [Candidatus Daviesbacteria bacterium RIFCSPHIGHO2_02_FULL_43_12]OGE70006.1 MAG: hypothetical protein A3B55_04915 [Candidatus Daviesbacteria bacterium RIFCSPLOWO2_01_FULL_43_15]